MAKLLNQGAYGCVYYPGFTCKGTVLREKKLITKLEIYDKTSKNEIEISNKIKKIKNFSKFFSPVIKHCISRFNEINKLYTKSVLKSIIFFASINRFHYMKSDHCWESLHAS